MHVLKSLNIYKCVFTRRAGNHQTSSANSTVKVAISSLSVGCAIVGVGLVIFVANRKKREAVTIPGKESSLRKMGVASDITKVIPMRTNDIYVHVASTMNTRKSDFVPMTENVLYGHAIPSTESTKLAV